LPEEANNGHIFHIMSSINELQHLRHGYHCMTRWIEKVTKKCKHRLLCSWTQRLLQGLGTPHQRQLGLSCTLLALATHVHVLDLSSLVSLVHWLRVLAIRLCSLLVNIALASSRHHEAALIATSLGLVRVGRLELVVGRSGRVCSAIEGRSGGVGSLVVGRLGRMGSLVVGRSGGMGSLVVGSTLGVTLSKQSTDLGQQSRGRLGQERLVGRHAFRLDRRLVNVWLATMWLHVSFFALVIPSPQGLVARRRLQWSLAIQGQLGKALGGQGLVSREGTCSRKGRYR
jgi:hypothetical protein